MLKQNYFYIKNTLKKRIQTENQLQTSPPSKLNTILKCKIHKNSLININFGVIQMYNDFNISTQELAFSNFFMKNRIGINLDFKLEMDS